MSPTIKAVNRIFIADKFKLSRTFELVTSNQFGAFAQAVNFSSSATLAIINKQVSDLTENKIQNLIPQGNIILLVDG